MEGVRKMPAILYVMFMMFVGIPLAGMFVAERKFRAWMRKESAAK